MSKQYTIEISLVQSKKLSDVPVEYEIVTITDIPEFPKNYNTALRRYRQFHSFNKKLEKIIKKAKSQNKTNTSGVLNHLPDFPPKKIWGSSSCSVITNRIIMFTNYLKFLSDKLSTNPDTEWAKEFIKFLSDNEYN